MWSTDRVLPAVQSAPDTAPLFFGNTTEELDHPIKKSVFPLDFYAVTHGTVWKMGSNRFVLVYSVFVVFFRSFFLPHPYLLLVCIFNPFWIFFCMLPSLLKDSATWVSNARAFVVAYGVRQMWPSLAASCFAVTRTQTTVFTFYVSICWERKCRYHVIQYVVFMHSWKGKFSSEN